MFWRIQHKDAKTGVWKTTLANSGITSIKAEDAGKPSARVWIKGHKLNTSGVIVDHQIMLSADVVKRAAVKLGLIEE